MKRNARKAFDRLKRLDAPVMDRQEWGAHFLMGAEKRTNNDRLWADWYGDEVKSEVREGHLYNAGNIRELAHTIAAIHGLRVGWINPGLVGFYDT